MVAVPPPPIEEHDVLPFGRQLGLAADFFPDYPEVAIAGVHGIDVETTVSPHALDPVAFPAGSECDPGVVGNIHGGDRITGQPHQLAPGGKPDGLVGSVAIPAGAEPLGRLEGWIAIVPEVEHRLPYH